MNIHRTIGGRTDEQTCTHATKFKQGYLRYIQSKFAQPKAMLFFRQEVRECCKTRG